MISFYIVRFCLVLLGVSALLSSNSDRFFAEARRRKLKFCKLDNLMECFNEPIAYFTSQANGTGIASTEEEMEQYCFNNHDYLPYCVQKWMKRCGSEMQVELAKRLFVVPMQQSMKIFCDSKGTIRPNFLKHSRCLIEEVKLAPDYRAQCVRQMQANQEYIHEMQVKSPNVTSFLSGFCCAYNQWERCIMGFLERKCGPESVEAIPFLIHHTTMDLLKGLCPQDRYDPTNPARCVPERFQAPADYKPLGYASNSLVSHYFSYLCPNVGWGLIPTRDF